MKNLNWVQNVVQVLVMVESITTPTKKGSKKRKWVKQTPSPSYNADDELGYPVEEGPGHGQTEKSSDQSESETTAEENVWVRIS